MTPRNYRQQELSETYLRAIVFNAGYNLSRPVVDTFGIDGTIEAPFRSGVNKIDYQLKSTTRYALRESFIAYDLRWDDYHRLTQADGLPRVLALYLMPREPELWLSGDEDELRLRHCAYWVSLMGQSVSPRTAQKRVYLPRANVLYGDGLDRMFDQLTG